MNMVRINYKIQPNEISVSTIEDMAINGLPFKSGICSFEDFTGKKL